MQFSDLLAIVRRRWYAPVAVFALAALLFVLFAQDGGTYATRTVITFTLPKTTSLTPGNGVADQNVIAFAGLVAGEVNNGRPVARYSEDAAPSYGAGVREGVLVSIPNAGNQWHNDFSRAEIELEIVGRTQEWVAGRQQDLVAAVLRVARERQAALVARPDDRIEVEVVPLTLGIEHVAASRTQYLMAAAAVGVAAAIVGSWLAVGIDRRARRRPARRRTGGASAPVGSTAR